MLGTHKSISALMTKMKNPSVTKINGALKINNAGRTNAFRMPSNSAAPINAPTVSYRMPLMNTGVTITDTVVIIQRKTKCRIAARYSKFLSSRNRFTKSACNTGPISRFGSQSETARGGQKIQNRNRKTSGRQRGRGTESNWRSTEARAKKGGAEKENRSCD